MSTFVPRTRVQFDYENFQGFLDPSRDCHEELVASNFQFPTNALFHELRGSREFKSLYSLTDKSFEVDGRIIPSMYQIYMHSVDETEAALKLVGTLANWRKLMDCPWFLNGHPAVNGHEGLAQWRLDMKARDEMNIKRLLMEEANSGNVTAMKTLFGDAPKPTSKGKSKQQTKGELSVVTPLTDLSVFEGFKKSQEG